MRIPTKKASTKKTRTAGDALRIIDRMIGKDHQLRELVVRAGINAHIAQLIYDARTKAGLTQSQLAKSIGTKQPVIARLEDSDYHGHSLLMLQRIAEALNQRLELRFLPAGNGLPKPKRQGSAIPANRRNGAATARKEHFIGV